MLIAFLYCFSVLVVFGTSPVASVSRLVGEFLREVVIPHAQQLVSEHPRLVVGSCVDSKGISCCLALGATLGLFVGSCVVLKTACELLEESIQRSR